MLAPTMEQKSKKYMRHTDYSWDYKGENTKSYTHGIHSYPAMFIPQVARRLLETYSHEGVACAPKFGHGLPYNSAMG